MEKVSARSNKSLFVLLISSLILPGGFYSTVAKADSPTQSLAGQQLAYFVGYHSYPSYVYYGPPVYRYHYRKLYWTGWRYVGYGCRSRCLVDRWSGRVLRCKRVCRY